MSAEEKISRLEETVKHLILFINDRELLGDPTNKEMTIKKHAEREQEHKDVFQKFLYWVAG